MKTEFCPIQQTNSHQLDEEQSNLLIHIYNFAKVSFSATSLNKFFFGQNYLKSVELTDETTKRTAKAQSKKSWFQLGTIGQASGTFVKAGADLIGLPAGFGQAVEALGSASSPLTHFAVGSQDPNITKSSAEKNLVEAHQQRSGVLDGSWKDLMEVIYRFGERAQHHGQVLAASLGNH